jgi:hypothetical protein
MLTYVSAMIRSKRISNTHEFLVFVGALLLVAAIFWLGAKNYDAARIQTQSQAEHHPASLPQTLRDTQGQPKTGEYEPYCNNPQNKDDSDLCAQWANAEQMRIGNQVTLTSVRLDSLNLIVSAIVAGLSAYAVILAARAAGDASLAVRSVTSVERAYLRPVIKRTSRKNGPRWIVTVVNHGNSPGQDVRYLFVTDPDEIASWKKGKRTEKDFALLASMIAKGDDCEIALPLHEGGALLCVAYTDVFDNRRIAWTEMSRSVNGHWNDTEHGENRAQSA